MAMEQTIRVLNRMVEDHVIGRYAIGGAVAAFNYVESSFTEDLDILISFENSAKPSALIVLTPIYDCLAKQGYTKHNKEGILVEGWPVQFLPVANALDEEALAEALDVNLKVGDSEESVTCRVLSPEHIVATALSVGRPKDWIRINQFIDQNAFDATRLCAILARHRLQEKWTGFCDRFEVADPCRSERKP